MLGGWRRYLELQAQSKTGLGSGLLAWGLLTVVSGATAFGFALVAVFIGLAERYSPLIAALAIGGCFLLIALIALVCCLQSRRRTMERAQLALAASASAPWLDPRLLGGALEVGRLLGWRKIAPLLILAVVAAGAGKRWLGRREPAKIAGASVRRETARAA